MSIFRRYALNTIRPRVKKPITPDASFGQIERLEVRELFAGDTANFLSPIWFEQLSTSAHSQIDAGNATFAESTTQVVWENTTLDVYNDEWIIQLDASLAASITSLTDVAALLDGGTLQFEIIGGLGLSGQLLIRTYDAEINAVTDWLAGQSIVTTFEPNALLPAHLATSDPQGDSLWGLDNQGQTGGTVDADIDAPEAWEITTGNPNIVVAVIDTGVDYTHPDLIHSMWVNPGEIAGDGIDNDGNGFVDDVYGYDFLNNDGDPMDDNMHGTHVAGTIAAEGDNATGVVGVASSASIMALKFLSASGSGSTADAVRALNYATMMKKLYGVNVVATNNSWGGGEYSSALYNAIKASGDEDILFVAAAGNNGTNNDVNPQYPASYGLDNVISVAATDHNDQLAGFSNYGASSVDIAAPGVGIVSTITRGRYLSLSGTSMAAPHVSGVIALAYSINPSATMEQIKAALLGGADDIAGLHGKVSTGGRLNALGTLHQLNFSVTDASIEAGAVVESPLTNFTIEFSGNFDPSTVAASDFLVNGQAADSLTVVNGNQVTFHYSQSPIVAQGAQRMELLAGSVERNGDGLALTGFVREFFYDAARLTITQTSIANGAALDDLPKYLDLIFSEAIDPATLTAADLQLSSGGVIAVEMIGDRTARFWLQLPYDNGEITYQLADGAVADLHGNVGAGITGHFSIDLVDIAIYETTGPIPLPTYGSIDIPLQISDDLKVADADIWLDIDHTWDSDLTVVLIAPNGTQIKLFSAIGGSGDGFHGTILDDDAEMLIGDAAAPFSGRFRPSGDLSLLEGMSTAGTWTLRVSDSFASDVGTLQSFGIHFSVASSLEIDPLDDITIHHVQDSLEVDVNASPGATISAKVLGDVPANVHWNAETGRLTIDPPRGYVGNFTVRVSAARGGETTWEEFVVSVTNDAVQLGVIADQTLSHDGQLELPLTVENRDGDLLTYIATATDAAGRLVEVAISDGVFRFDATSAAAGNVQVTISVSDGVSTATQTFSITISAAPIAADPLPSEFAGTSGKPLEIDLSQYDFGQGMTDFEVAAPGGGTTTGASQYGVVQDDWLEQTNFAYNSQRQGEKYVKTESGQWCFVTTDGQHALLHEWKGSFVRSTVIATLDISYYNDPKLLYQNEPATPQADVDVAIDPATGKLVVTPRDGFAGRITLTVTATGSNGAETRTFDVVFAAQTLELAPIANDQFPSGETRYTLDLRDYLTGGDSVVLSTAATAVSDAEAYAIDKAANFVSDPFLSRTNYAYNAYGHQEKFIRDANYQWYYLTQEGDQAVLYKWQGDIGGGDRIATLDSAYYEDPSLLVNAAETSGDVTARIENGQLIVDRPANFTGDVIVTVAATNGSASVSQVFRIAATTPAIHHASSMVDFVSASTAALSIRSASTSVDASNFAPPAASPTLDSIQAQVAAIAAEVALRFGDDIDSLAQSRTAPLPTTGAPRTLGGSISQKSDQLADVAAAQSARDERLSMPTIVNAMDAWGDQIASDLAQREDSFSVEADDLYSSLDQVDFELPEA
ncbi:S8 family serine peptidase [Blastopirellula marina]|uniref:Serine protease, subtilase family protein n=1 Tax=Blastopirellula marina DSM 3645 TaxID=314230 RepID=A3ZU35_9BACT|nr:S8 family serine peptidase [Blastopirellula marina]EAQ80099.1 serine protease, subtilase family protein [Blastopirellula marina DSM 3645]